MPSFLYFLPSVRTVHANDTCFILFDRSNRRKGRKRMRSWRSRRRRTLALEAFRRRGVGGLMVLSARKRAREKNPWWALACVLPGTFLRGSAWCVLFEILVAFYIFILFFSNQDCGFPTKAKKKCCEKRAGKNTTRYGTRYDFSAGGYFKPTW